MFTFERKIIAMKKLIIVLFVCFNAFGQNDSTTDSIQKTNPVIFSEGYFGGSGSNNGGLLLLGYNLNYQFNDKDLLTARFSGLLGVYDNYVLASPLLILPFSTRKEAQVEYALLYGKRWVYNNLSFSVSTGISHVDRDYYKKENDYFENLSESYFGVPVELNIKWFKPVKKRFRAYYGLIPIGKRKVSFGRSVGFKLTGNFARNSNIGLAFTYGFGWHKKY